MIAKFTKSTERKDRAAGKLPVPGFKRLFTEARPE